MRSVLISDVQMDFTLNGELLLQVVAPKHVPRQDDVVVIGLDTYHVMRVVWSFEGSCQQIFVRLSPP